MMQDLLLLRKADQKKGISGIIKLVVSVMTLFLVGGLLAYTIVVSMGILADVDVVDDQIAENSSLSIIRNVSSGVESFWSRSTTIFTILAIAAIIGGLALVIVIVKRAGSGGGGV